MVILTGPFSFWEVPLKNLFLRTMLSLSLRASDRQYKPNKPPSSGQDYNNEHDYNNDNTEKNILDRAPCGQSENEDDRSITHQVIISDNSFSTNEKNSTSSALDDLLHFVDPLLVHKKKMLVKAKLMSSKKFWESSKNKLNQYI